MTYPPGPGPAGPPPDRRGGPYGAGPYGGYGQPGQRPGYQAPPQYPQWPQPGFPPPGGPAPPPPPPPRKRHTGLWVTLSTVAAGLVVFLVTGFAAPGFLLGDQEGGPHAGSGGDISDPKQLALALVDGVNARDKQTLHKLTCPTAPARLDSNIDNIALLSDVELTLVRTVSPTKAVARLELTVRGSRVQVLSDLRKENGTWCWQNWEATADLATI